MLKLIVKAFGLCLLLFMQMTKSEEITEVNQFVEGLINTHKIPGLAVAVIQDGKIIHKKSYGLANIEHSVPVTNDTIFRVYSTTKLLTSTAIFQLIDENKLSLDDKLSQFFKGLPKEWSEVTIAHLLAHASGIPEIANPSNSLEVNHFTLEEVISNLSKQPMQFSSGDAFVYNQSNYYFLAKIIEKISGLSFSDYVLKNQLNQTEAALFSSDSLAVIKDRGSKYEFDGKTKSYRITSYNQEPLGHSGNGLNISLNEFIKWNQRLDEGQLISDAAKSKMWSKFEFNNPKDEFLHGWGLYQVNGKDSYGFTGGAVSGFRKFAVQNLTIIYLSNGYKYYPVHNTAIDIIAGIVDKTLYEPKKILDEEVKSAFLKQDFDDAVKYYKSIKDENPKINFQPAINAAGYSSIVDGGYQKAIKLFELNVNDYPDSWIAHDSVAEAYENLGNKADALIHYRKALLLNVHNQYNYREHHKKKIKMLSD